MKKATSSKRAAARGRQSRTKDSKRKSTKQAESNRRAVKRTASPLTVEAYFAAVPEPARSALNQIREAVRSVVPPEAAEIISYKIPAFKHRKVLVWYAAFSNHCSLFPTAAVIEQFKDELKDFSTSKGTVHFPLDKPMPVELIRKMVTERLGRSG